MKKVLFILLGALLGCVALTLMTIGEPDKNDGRGTDTEVVYVYDDKCDTADDIFWSDEY